MTIKLALLKSGEDIIADIQEMMVEDKVVGYYFVKPYVAGLVPTQPEEDGTVTAPYKLNLRPWILLTDDQTVPVVADWIVSIVEPVENLTKAYLEVANYGQPEPESEPETAPADEQPDTADAD